MNPPSSICSILFFFFQAEDGIRDYKVTGVQTCALPISTIGIEPASSGGAATPTRWESRITIERETKYNAQPTSARPASPWRDPSRALHGGFRRQRQSAGARLTRAANQDQRDRQ